MIAEDAARDELMAARVALWIALSVLRGEAARVDRNLSLFLKSGDEVRRLGAELDDTRLALWLALQALRLACATRDAG